MDSINEIIDSETFCHQLVDESNGFITVRQEHQIQEGESDCEVGISVRGFKKVQRTDNGTPPTLCCAMQTLITTTHDENEIQTDDESRSVVMVIDELGQNDIQTTYQIMSGQLQLQRKRISPTLSIIQTHADQRDRLVTHSSGDFVGTDISLDSLTNNTSSRIVSVKQEHKVVIVPSDDQLNDINQTMSDPNSPCINMSSISVIDDLSSDDGGPVREVNFNQHHLQLFNDQNNKQHHQQEQNHQQYGDHHHSSQFIQQNDNIQGHNQSERQLPQHSIHLEIGHHHEHIQREEFSVIVQPHDDAERNREADDADQDSSDPLLNSPLEVDNTSLEHSSYQTLTSMNNRISPDGFSSTSYATLTPIQPLPPISTMSEKFAYVGHISGSTNSSGSGNSEGALASRITIDATSNECNSYTSLPISITGTNQGSLASIGMSVLAGVQSPYSSFEKLPSLSMISPPHNYGSPPSHGLSSVVESCDLQNHNSPVPSPIAGQVVSRGCCAASPRSELHSQSPKPVHNSHPLQVVSVTLQKQVICLSPSSELVDGVVSNGFESSYGVHQLEQQNANISIASRANTGGGLISQQQLQNSPTLSQHSVSAGSVVSMSLHSPHINGSVPNISVEMPVVVPLTPTPPPGCDGNISVDMCDIIEQHGQDRQSHLIQADIKAQQDHDSLMECNQNILLLSNAQSRNNINMCNINEEHQNRFINQQHQAKITTDSDKTTVASPGSVTSSAISRSGISSTSDGEEINTKELAQRISAELKRYSIPQAIFAQRVLCRSQGTLSDLLRNPKPWSKLKSGRETFRRMFKWLQEPEFQRMSALRIAAAQIPQRPSSIISSGSASNAVGVTSTSALILPSTPSTVLSISSSNTLQNIPKTVLESCSTPSASLSLPISTICRRKEEPQIEQMPHPKKPRLVFTDLQRRTLQAIFKETKRPSKEMQVTIARQLGLEPTTVGNFFMNARRRSMDKWREDDPKGLQHTNNRHNDDFEETEIIEAHSQYGNIHTTAMSPIGHFDEEGDIDMELENHDYLVGDHDGNDQDDML